MQTAEQNVLQHGRVIPPELDGSLGRTRHCVALGLEGQRLSASPLYEFSWQCKSECGPLIALHCFETHVTYRFASANHLVQEAGSDDGHRP
jgi:hypothetical protein